jgi:hypothetical protein
MRKTTKKPLSLTSETIRQLDANQLSEIAGGYTSIPCGTRGCSIQGCLSQAPTCADTCTELTPQCPM